MIVKKIREGFVIDHIPAERGLTVLGLLEAEEKSRGPIILLMNVESKKMGKKDIVKLIDMSPKKQTVDKISLVAPNATFNAIKDFNVVEKRKAERPNRVVGILRCPNPKCITNDEKEHVTSVLRLMDRESPLYVCQYCDRMVEEEAIPDLLL